jgi:membrane associated rhomboid family serine protease
MDLKVALMDKRVLLASGVFLGLNVLAIFGLGSVEAPGGIAWEAHIGGYLAGLLAFGIFDVPNHSSSHPHNKPSLH